MISSRVFMLTAGVQLLVAAVVEAETFEGRVRSGSGDVEERSTGSVSLGSNDLEMVTDGAYQQIVGIRWEGVAVPRGASVTSADVQFTAAKQASSVSTGLTIHGQAAGNAAPFSSVKRNVSTRAKTTAIASWTPPTWARNSAGAAERVIVTPILQELVNRADWVSDNAVALIITGTGHRNAKSYEGSSTQAPLLHVEYTTTADTEPPSVALTSPADDAVLAGVATLTAQAADNVGVTAVTFLQDSEPLGTDFNAPFAYAWDTTKVDDGLFTLTAAAEDAAGNRSESSPPVSITVANAGAPPPPPPPSGTLVVPDQFATVQAAIDAAGNGDTVLVRPGTYAGGLVIAGKRLTLESEYRSTGDTGSIEGTTIAGGSPILDIAASAVGVVVDGLTFTSGEKHVVANGDRVTVRNSRFVNSGSDAMSFERTGGTVSGNTFLNPHDDCVDADAPLDAVVENNTCTAPGDDGIEIRNNHPAATTFAVRNNTIIGADEDGVQIIDYPDVSNRVFRIERNEIRNSAGVGVGIMGGGQTVEDYSGHSMPERVYVLNNTFDGNEYAITGGDNLIALNNIFSNSSVLALKNVDGNSVVSYSLFWNNAVNIQASNVLTTNDVTADPLYVDRTNGNLRLRSGSPAIDAGTASYTHLGETVLTYPAGAYAGAAPDLGGYETVPAP